MPATARPRRLRVPLLAALALTTACYHAAPVSAPSQPGARVTLTLTPTGSGDLAATVGPNVTEAEGIVTAVRGDTLVLGMIRTTNAARSETLWRRETVAIPRSAVAAMTERRLDRKRSWLAAGVIVGLAAFAAARLSGGGAGPGDFVIVAPPN